MTHDDRYYHSLAAKYSDALVHSYTGAGRLAMPLTRGWAVYNRAVYPVRDGQGTERLVTLKQHKVYMWALGQIAKDDCNTTLRAMGTALGMCPQTVSNALGRFMSWGVLGYLSSRGKYGGLTLFGRSKGDGLDHFARMAMAAIRQWWARKRAGSGTKSNVHTYTDGGSRPLTTRYLSSVWTLDFKSERDDRIEAHLMGLQRGMLRRVPCPAHGGEDRNLSFWRRPDGSLGAKCWSHQCTEREVKDAIEPWPGR